MTERLFGRQLGWKKDKFDRRDYLHKRRVKTLPSKLILSWTPLVRDQGNLGSCVGFSVGGNVTGMAMLAGVYTEWFSPTWIYNGARFIDGSLNQDVGAYPRDALDWLVAKGCLLEHFWPYVDALDPTPPPSRYDIEAAKFPVLSYYRITGGVAAICDAIASGHFVSIGTPWYDTWMNPPGTGLLPDISGRSSMVGGHETLLFGYDIPNRLFYGQNSWGGAWGNGGRYLMPFQALSYFSYGGGYDAHYVMVEWKSVPSASESPSASPSPSPSHSPSPSARQPVPVRIRLQESDDGGETYRDLYEFDID